MFGNYKLVNKTVAVTVPGNKWEPNHPRMAKAFTN